MEKKEAAVKMGVVTRTQFFLLLGAVVFVYALSEFYYYSPYKVSQWAPPYGMPLYVDLYSPF